MIVIGRGAPPDEEWSSTVASTENLAQELATAEEALQTAKHRSRQTLQVDGRPRPCAARLSAEWLASIRTDNVQHVTCENCCEEVRLQDMRKHEQNCAMALMQCPLFGCRARVPRRELRRHFNEDCAAYRARNELAMKSLSKKERIIRTAAVPSPPPRRRKEKVREAQTPVERPFTATLIGKSAESEPLQSGPQEFCPQCQARLDAGELDGHLLQSCSIKPVSCPNSRVGCSAQLPLCRLLQHLNTECEVEKRHEEMVKRSKHRRDIVECPGCGQAMQLMHMSKHQREDCENKKVHCKNWHCGCSTMVRVRQLKAHTDVSAVMRPRACLRFRGGDSRIEINENDAKPSWTAEYWVWRPDIEEALGYRMTEVLKLRKRFQDAQRKEHSERLRIESDRHKLQVSCDDGAERVRVCAEIVGHISLYEEAIFQTSLAAHNLKLSLESVSLLTAQLEEQGHDRADAFLNRVPELVATNVTIGEDAKQIYQALSSKIDESKPFTEGPASIHTSWGAVLRSVHKIKEDIDVDLGALHQTRVAAGMFRENESAHMKSNKVRKPSRKRLLRQSSNASANLSISSTNATVTAPKLSKRIADELRSRAGRDAVASSADVRLMLDAGPSGQLAFATSTEGVTYFNATCPRGRWTHVCLVQTQCGRKDSRKPKLVLYLDGVRRAALEDVCIELPMGLLGDDHNSLLGCLQEVRYWGCALKPLEIQQFMHALLPLQESTQEKGLMAWLKFEEGEGRTVDDISEQRFRLAMKGGVSWVHTDDTGEEAPTPSYKERYLCVVELRRAKLAQKGRALLQEVPCDSCAGMVPRKDLRFHKQFVCLHRKVECRFWACGATFPEWERGEHERRDCAVQKQRALLVEQHEMHTVPVVCEDCEEIVPTRQLARHQGSECIQRVIGCPEGCGVQLTFSRLEHHLAHFCTAPSMIRSRELVIRSRKRNPQRRPW